jgi:hypothetical protein
LLKTFSAREGIGYQVLIKKWLDDRLRQELARIRGRKEVQALPTPARQSSRMSYAPTFPLVDRDRTDGSHYSCMSMGQVFRGLRMPPSYRKTIQAGLWMKL